MNHLFFELVRFATHLELSLLRASWQGGLAIVSVWLLTRALPRLSGRAQSWLWRAAYLKLLIALIWATPVDLPLLPPRGPVMALRPASSIEIASTQPWSPSPTYTFQSSARISFATGSALSTPALPVAPVESNASATPTAPVTPKAPNDIPLTLMLIWLAGAAAHGFGAFRGERSIRSCRRAAVCLRATFLVRMRDELRLSMGVRQSVALLEIDDPGVPMLVGEGEPAILLPSVVLTGCSPDELRLILAHELAHLRRGDRLWSRLPILGRVLFWFHPLLWLADKEWRHSQEAACDEIAISYSGAAPVDYGSVLIKVAALCRGYRVSGFAGAAAIESYRTLRRRLIAMQSFQKHHRRPWASAGIGLVILGIAAIVPWRVVAQRSPAAAASKQMSQGTPKAAAPQTPAESEIGQETRAEAAAELPQAWIRLNRAEEQFRATGKRSYEYAQANFDVAKAEAVLQPGPQADQMLAEAAIIMHAMMDERYQNGKATRLQLEDAKYQEAIARTSGSHIPALKRAMATVDYAKELLFDAGVSNGKERAAALETARKQLAAAQNMVAELQRKR